MSKMFILRNYFRKKLKQSKDRVGEEKLKFCKKKRIEMEAEFTDEQRLKRLILESRSGRARFVVFKFSHNSSKSETLMKAGTLR